MEYKQIHDYLTVNEKDLDVHHMHFLTWLKMHSNFLIGIEKYFLMLRDELSEFVHNPHPRAVNKELIDDYANKSHFTRLEKKEDNILSDINNFRALCKKRSSHDLTILDYLAQLEIKCLTLTKYIRPEFTIDA